MDNVDTSSNLSPIPYKKLYLSLIVADDITVWEVVEFTLQITC